MTRKHLAGSALEITDGIISSKWSIEIIRVLLTGPARFSRLRASIPAVSATVLIAKLRYLEGMGVVTKCTLPPPADCEVYDLTALGRGAEPTVKAIEEWAKSLQAWKTQMPATPHEALQLL
jgi:DNA-binding HxlR family transcriptional regulator